MTLISDWQESLLFIFEQLRWQDFVDVFFVWLIIYQLLILIKKTGTIQILSGLGFLAFVYLVSIWLDLFTFNWLLDKFFSHLFLIIVVLFQGEIRRALAHIGANPFFTEISPAHELEIVENVVRACHLLLEKRSGALIVFEREILLDYHIEMGTKMGSEVSAEVLLSLFHLASPLHDGAVLIRGGKIYSAGNLLPLSKNAFLDKNLGTRHRAALGLSEETDALIVVLSEERQAITVAYSGNLITVTDGLELKNLLLKELKSHHHAKKVFQKAAGR